MPINLAIVDNQILFRKMLVRYLLKQKDIYVTIQASDMLDLINHLKDHAEFKHSLLHLRIRCAGGIATRHSCSL
jgi:DNA-binding NarL/FixJ family response regulator